MTDEQLQRLAALAEAATPARWIAEQGMGVRLADYTPICMSSVTGEPVNVDANMAFIAAARQAVPELLAESIVLRRQLEYANRWRESAILDANEARSEAADLRRQVAHANRWRDTAIIESNEARAEAAAARAERQEFRTAFIVAHAAFAAESAQRERADAEVADLRQQLATTQVALKSLLDAVPPCTCHEAYSSRGLVAPDCIRCQLEPELSAAADSPATGE